MKLIYFFLNKKTLPGEFTCFVHAYINDDGNGSFQQSIRYDPHFQMSLLGTLGSVKADTS